MSRTASPRLRVYTTLGAGALLASFLLGRPELAALAAPLFLILALGLCLAAEPGLRLEAALDRDHLVEGEEVHVELEAIAGRPVEHADVFLPLPRGLPERTGSGVQTIRLAAGERQVLSYALVAERWGGYVLDKALVRTRGPLGLVVHEWSVPVQREVRVYPREEIVRALVSARETQVLSGNEVSRAKGEGIEFADIRPFMPGDRVRRVNWRASARRPELWVNELHPERNADVILFIDSFEEARREGLGTLDLAVRAAATLAGRYLARRDRVGLVGFGAALRWLLPRMGVNQLYRIVEALIDTEVSLSYAWRGIDVVPRRMLPPKALVCALTPLLDARSVRALLDLRARGYDLVVFEVSPLPFARAASSPSEQLSRRLWELKREALRYRYERDGVPVADWRAGTELAEAIEEVNEFRRYVRRARV